MSAETRIVFIYLNQILIFPKGTGTETSITGVAPELTLKTTTFASATVNPGPVVCGFPRYQAMNPFMESRPVRGFGSAWN